MTNFDKLVRWDADWYKSLSDDDCIVCLTEKQVYLLLMAVDPLTWVRTRWAGDISGLDMEGIKGELVQALIERMNCETLSQILSEVEKIRNKLDQIYISEGAGDTTIIIDETTLQDIFSIDDQQDDLADISACDNDVIYGGVNQLVRYIHAKNEDFLQYVSQAGNVGEVTELFLEAGMPILESLLPFDEMAGYAGFVLEELIDEYDATVDEDLLQETICDLFCIATAGGSCNLDYADLIGYFSSKVPASFSTFTSTFLDLVQFALTGTMSGDEYFYYMCYFQLWIIYAGERFIGINDGFEAYANQMRAGANSPDADWEIFCDPCNPVYWYHIQRFEFGLAKWEVVEGTLNNGRIESNTVGSQTDLIDVRLTVPSSFDLKKIQLTYTRENSVASGSDFVRFEVSETEGAPFTLWYNTGGFEGNGDYVRCVNPISDPYDSFRTVRFVMQIVGGMSGSQKGYLDIVEMWGRDNMDYGVYASEIEDC